ncbi:hypothetical protein HDE_14426 [Halotydeus destructor]|nr:hypothetical protein HDE_14426 [Halotydeus destructor]
MFNSLNDVDEDCIFEVFRFLNIKDRVRFERISSQWRRQLERLWQKQQALAFSTQHPYHSFVCGISSHRISSTDCVDLPAEFAYHYFPSEEEDDLRARIIARCPHLKVLDWCDFDYQVWLPRCLKTICSDIEHVQNVKGASFLIDNFKHLTCVQVNDKESLSIAISKRMNIYLSEEIMFHEDHDKIVDIIKNKRQPNISIGFASLIASIEEAIGQRPLHFQHYPSDQKDTLFLRHLERWGKEMTHFRHFVGCKHEHYGLVAMMCPNLKNITVDIDHGCNVPETFEYIRMMKTLKNIEIRITRFDYLESLEKFFRLTQARITTIKLIMFYPSTDTSKSKDHMDEKPLTEYQFDYFRMLFRYIFEYSAKIRTKSFKINLRDGSKHTFEVLRTVFDQLEVPDHVAVTFEPSNITALAVRIKGLMKRLERS